MEISNDESKSLSSLIGDKDRIIARLSEQERIIAQLRAELEAKRRLRIAMENEVRRLEARYEKLKQRAETIERERRCWKNFPRRLWNRWWRFVLVLQKEN